MCELRLFRCICTSTWSYGIRACLNALYIACYLIHAVVDMTELSSMLGYVLNIFEIKLLLFERFRFIILVWSLPLSKSSAILASFWFACLKVFWTNAMCDIAFFCFQNACFDKNAMSQKPNLNTQPTFHNKKSYEDRRWVKFRTALYIVWYWVKSFSRRTWKSWKGIQ